MLHRASVKVTVIEHACSFSEFFYITEILKSKLLPKQQNTCMDALHTTWQFTAFLSALF